MKKIVLSVLFLMLIIFTIYIAYIIWKNNFPSNSKEWWIYLNNVAKEINKNLPFKLDNKLILKKVIAWPWKKITFIVLFNNTKKELEIKKEANKNIYDNNRNNIISYLCKDKNWYSFLKKNINIYYEYFDKNNLFLYKNKVSLHDCMKKREEDMYIKWSEIDLNDL